MFVGVYNNEQTPTLVYSTSLIISHVHPTRRRGSIAHQLCFSMLASGAPAPGTMANAAMYICPSPTVARRCKVGSGLLLRGRMLNLDRKSLTHNPNVAIDLYPSVYLPIYLSFYLTICNYNFVSIYLSIYPSIYLCGEDSNRHPGP